MSTKNVYLEDDSTNGGSSFVCCGCFESLLCEEVVSANDKDLIKVCNLYDLKMK